MNLENAVAVVGFGCRYPGGVNDASSFLDLLHDRRVAVRPPPSERWNMERYFGTETSGPARMYTREAGFLNESVKRFDAEIFGISPREAHAMDRNSGLCWKSPSRRWRMQA
nr:beta-ketoacyl synthase N-terminal-like domain-containing protein [Pseudovibrio denitrificans]